MPFRIILRQWTDADLTPFAEMNADPEVMRYFPRLQTLEESKESMQRQRTLLDERGWGWWAVEVEGRFAGFTGLAVPRFSAPFTPCVEIGWRLRREYWGRSIAFAAARAAEAYAFAELKLPEMLTFTAAINVPSRRLMERLGYQRNPAEDFLHPSLAQDSPICLHVLYRKSAPIVNPAKALNSAPLDGRIPTAQIRRP
jgi:RimJ/RimL family protein N-acetyltransferase